MTTKVKPILLLSALPLLWAGCTTTNPQAAFNEVGKTVKTRTGQDVLWMRDDATGDEITQAVTKLLQNDLTVQSAMAVALLNNRSLQAEFEKIGISQADLAQTSRLHNPEIIGLWRFPDRPPSAMDAEYSIAADFLDLLTLPARTKIAANELEQMKLMVANEVLKLAADTQAAFYTAQARQQLVTRLEAILEVNAATADLAKRQHDAGNINDLAFHNQQAIYAQATLNIVQTRALVRMDRERLNRLLGLWGAQTNWKIFGELPALPEKELPLANLESLAVKQRLDLAAMHSEVQTVAGALGLKEETLWIPGITLGIDTERQTDGQNVTGPSLGLELPIFDQGQPALAKLAAEYRQAERRYEALAIDIRSEVRDARDALLAARDMAQFYQSDLLPQRQQILRETLLQYNAMQMSSYELLASKENEQIAERGYIEALRDYWIARAELERAVGGQFSDTTLPSMPAPEASPETHDHP